jgi:hypothetical protein
MRKSKQILICCTALIIPKYIKAIFHCSRFARAGGANITQLSV